MPIAILDFADLVKNQLPHISEKELNSISEHEINQMKNDPDNYCKVWREFNTQTRPAKWIVWPHSRSKGWCDMITGQL